MPLKIAWMNKKTLFLERAAPPCRQLGSAGMIPVCFYNDVFPTQYQELFKFLVFSASGCLRELGYWLWWSIGSACCVGLPWTHWKPTWKPAEAADGSTDGDAGWEGSDAGTSWHFLALLTTAWQLLAMLGHPCSFLLRCLSFPPVRFASLNIRWVTFLFLCVLPQSATEGRLLVRQEMIFASLQKDIDGEAVINKGHDGQAILVWHLYRRGLHALQMTEGHWTSNRSCTGIRWNFTSKGWLGSRARWNWRLSWNAKRPWKCHEAFRCWSKH